MTRAERQSQPVKYAMLRGRLVPRDDVLRAQIVAQGERAEPAPVAEPAQEPESASVVEEAPKPKRGRPAKKSAFEIGDE